MNETELNASLPNWWSKQPTIFELAFSAHGAISAEEIISLCLTDMDSQNL